MVQRVTHDELRVELRAVLEARGGRLARVILEEAMSRADFIASTRWGTYVYADEAAKIVAWTRRTYDEEIQKELWRIGGGRE